MPMVVYTEEEMIEERQKGETEGAVLFECEAPDILAADEMLKAATGHIAVKDASIWCGFEEIECQ